MSEESAAVRLPDPAPAAPASLPPHLLSRIAHDIRSPIGLVSGAIEEIREDLGTQLDEGQLRMLALAERGLARLERMAKMLSTIAQIEERSLSLSREPHDLAHMLREIAQGLERDDPRRGLTLSLELPDAAPIEADPDRLRESLWELAGQARRQAKSAVRIALVEKPSAYEVLMEDDGRAMDSTQRKYTFDRVHQPPDRRGTGFGLSVARDLLRAHGGDVVVGDSSFQTRGPGTGSSFIVTIPR